MSKHTKKSPSNQLTLFEAPNQVYQSENGNVEVVLSDGDMWVSQKTMSLMFGVNIRTVNEHIHNVIRDDKLGDSVVRKFRITATDGKSYEVNQYNLDVVLPVGYRVHSPEASKFRKWANGILRDYITKGIVVNPDSPQARKYKKALELADKIGWTDEKNIQHLHLALGLLESLGAINTMAKQVVINPQYGRLMNAEYESLFGYTATGLKAILKGNVRETLGNEAMATLLFAETMLTGLLARSKQISMDEAIAIYIDALKPVRAMHDALCERFGIHPITSKPLLTSGK